MPSKSSIERLPAEIRELIGRLFNEGKTLDQIMAKLRELLPPKEMVSRSALGRHTKQLSSIGEELQRQRVVAEALAAQYGEELADGRTARLNIALAHGMMTKLMFAEDGGMASFDAEEAMFLARAIQSLVTAQKGDAEREMKIRERLRKEATEQAAKVAETVAREGGASEEQVAFIRAKILGIGERVETNA